MCSDFQTEDACSDDDDERVPRPRPARCWLISETTWLARSLRFVPQAPSGVQFVAAAALPTSSTGATASRSDAPARAPARRERRDGMGRPVMSEEKTRTLAQPYALYRVGKSPPLNPVPRSSVSCPC